MATAFPSAGTACETTTGHVKTIEEVVPTQMAVRSSPPEGADMGTNSVAG